MIYRLINYAKYVCEPKIERSAESLLIKQYIKYRLIRCVLLVNTIEMKNEKQVVQNSKISIFPITVRHLEALIRISKAFARISLSSKIEIKHVQQAIKLFNTSTFHLINSRIITVYL